jgi:chromosomal replication initiator protein
MSEILTSLWRGPIHIRPRHKPMSEIAQEVADKYGVTVEQLKGRGNARWISQPRQEAMTRAYEETPNSTTAVGRFFGNRDHTTVLHALKAHERRMAG